MCQYISFAFTFGAVEMWSVVIGVERTFTMIYAAFFFLSDLLSGVGARSNNSTPIAGASGSTSVNQSRKSPDFNQKDQENRASSRGSGGAQTRQNDQRNQRGNGTGNRGQNARGGRSRGRAGAMGQGSFNRFAGNFANRSKTPLKFEEDYDFESANVKVLLISNLSFSFTSVLVWRLYLVLLSLS